MYLLQPLKKKPVILSGAQRAESKDPRIFILATVALPFAARSHHRDFYFIASAFSESSTARASPSFGRRLALFQKHGGLLLLSFSSA